MLFDLELRVGERLHQNTFPITSSNIWYNLTMECAIYTSIKHLNMKPCVNEKTHWALIIDCVIISTNIYV